jgi:hypothetical protein
MYFCKVHYGRVESLAPGLRALTALDNANDGAEAGPCALTGNNVPSNANENYGAFLNYMHEIGMSLPQWGNISKDDRELGNSCEKHTCRKKIAEIQYDAHNTMRRIRDRKENETSDNLLQAYENFSKGKEKRHNIKAFEKDLDKNLSNIIKEISNENWEPSGYKRKVIFEKKKRILAKAPIHDHVLEAAEILPYERQLYDYISWKAPAVRPNMGTHALLRFIRNDLYKSSQNEMMYNLSMDAHHYFPLMDHQILKDKLDHKVKPGKFRRFLDKVVDSYLQGVPLGIKIAQIFGQVYLADFDRMAERFFDIGKDPEKLSYWTSIYITDKIATAITPDDEILISKGTQFLADRFRYFVKQGLRHYYRFVDNMVFFHEDKTVLHIVAETSVAILARDYHITINGDYNVRPTWMGLRLVGYQFYHDRTMLGKKNKKELCRHVAELRKKGLTEEQIRIRQASRFGYAKHANTIHLIKSIGMEKSLGKIIKKHRIHAPFDGMDSEQKVKFSSICKYLRESTTGWNKKILLEDYNILDSKINKKQVTVNVQDSSGTLRDVPKVVPGKALAIRFKKILKTEEKEDSYGNVTETYAFEKKRDKDGNPTLLDAEYYAYTGSRILIDQATHDFSREDLPCPTVIQQFEGKNGQDFFKFT